MLKKSVCKGDKKKKKEITEEIARKELELDKRHNEELANFKMSNITIADNEEGKKEGPKEESDDEKATEQVQKVSKAQKRRNKKANAEKERDQRIIEQEALNVFGKRNVETETIKKILLERELMIHEISSDGHW